MSDSQSQDVQTSEPKHAWVRKVLGVDPGTPRRSGPTIGSNRGTAPTGMPETRPSGPRRTDGPTLAPQRDPGQQEGKYNAKLREAVHAIEIARGLAAVNDKAATAHETMEDSLSEAVELAKQSKFLEAIPLLDKAIQAATEISDERVAMREDFLKRHEDTENKFKPLEQKAAGLKPLFDPVAGLLKTAKDAEGETEQAGEADPEDWPQAIVAVDKFEKAVTALDGPLTAQSDAMPPYTTRRGKLRDDEAAIGRIKNPVDPLKGLVEKYTRSAGTVNTAANQGDFVTALGAMGQLETDAKAAAAEKLKGIVKTTKATVDDIMNTLQQDDGSGNALWEQEDSPAPSQEWKDAVTKILSVKLDEDYQARYDEKCEQTAKLLAEDPIVQNANKNWKDWCKDIGANKVEMEKAMNKIVEIQSKVIGIDPPVQVKFFHSSDKGLCGQYNPDDNDITLNDNQDGLDDFRELLDTLTHENTHALQATLVKRYEDGTIPETDPDFPTAMALWMNDNEGYIQSDNSAKYDGTSRAYKEQVCEAHAWRAGEKAGRAAYALLNPPPTA